MTFSSFTVVPWRPEFAGVFRALNMAWIEELFTVEQADLDVLDDPEGVIIASGGEVFFALVDGVPVGTCALHRMPDGRWELTKMTVDVAQRGSGIGEALGLAAVDHVRHKGGELFLYTNSSLQGAIRLYERLGFVHRRMPGDNPYARGDVYMVLPI